MSGVDPDSAIPPPQRQSSIESVTAEVEKLLASNIFRHSDRLRRFLRFVVEQAARGENNKIKEYVIGTEVFDKPAGYSPSADPIVRVEARRLRSKLKDYYETQGRDDPVVIELPKGSYVPVFTVPSPAAAVPPPAALGVLATRRRRLWAGATAACAILIIAYLAARVLFTRLAVGPVVPASIAVLPLVNLSPDPESVYMADGLTEDLISALARADGLHVVARTSAFQFRGPSHDLKKIRRQLRVATILEGTVRRTGNRLRVTAQLINTADGFHLWSEVYDRDWKDVFEIRDDICRDVAQALKLHFAAGPGGQFKRHPEDPAVYELYWKGRYQWNKRTLESVRRGIDYFREAIDRDPLYALAYTGLADSYILLGSYGIFPPKDVFPIARESAQRALRIDNSLAEAHTALGGVKMSYDWDLRGAESEFKQAIQLNPGYPTAHQWYAELLSARGDHEHAIRQAHEAQNVDPLSLISHASVALALYYARRYDAAIEHCKKEMEEIDPNFPVTHFFLGYAYLQKGMNGDAIRQFQEGVASFGGRGSAYLAHAYAVAGRRDEALKILEELKAESAKAYVSPFDFALLYIGLGDADRAIFWLERAVSDRSNYLVFLNVDPRFDRIRSNARVRTLLRKAGLE